MKNDPIRKKASCRTAAAPAATANRKSEIINHKPEIILLAVTGMSPAILTETVWALAQGTPAVIPHRIVAITTLPGKARIEDELSPHCQITAI